MHEVWCAENISSYFHMSTADVGPLSGNLETLVAVRKNTVVCPLSATPCWLQTGGRVAAATRHHFDLVYTLALLRPCDRCQSVKPLRECRLCESVYPSSPSPVWPKTLFNLPSTTSHSPALIQAPSFLIWTELLLLPQLVNLPYFCVILRTVLKCISLPLPLVK